ncbi:MAG: hypothetical protein DRO05_05440 [Thermoproteota archaeon]|nr:MAG: hypothetical protein DRO05_05440 [Candidatus Korarchaeota archaeon]
MRKVLIFLLVLLILFPSTMSSGSTKAAYVISNQIDWELNFKLLYEAIDRYGITLRRVRNLSKVKGGNVLILGGHLAPTDEWMPKNYADDFLNDEEKKELESGLKSFLIKVLEKDGNRITIIAGYNRHNTSLAAQSSNDWDTLPNAIEAMLGTNPRKGDTDDDMLRDDKEVLEYLTDPLLKDTDSDGESDSAEVLVYGTDPTRAEDWKDFKVVVGILDTPEKITRYMKDHFTYIPDPPDEDVWQTAEETFYKGGGDCEDFAIFALYCLRAHGWRYDAFDLYKNHSAAVLGIIWSGIEFGHAVLVYVEEGRFYIIHSGIIPTEGPFPDLESLINKVAFRLFGFTPPWEYYIYINERGQITGRVERG